MIKAYLVILIDHTGSEPKIKRAQITSQPADSMCVVNGQIYAQLLSCGADSYEQAECLMDEIINSTDVFKWIKPLLKGTGLEAYGIGINKRLTR